MAERAPLTPERVVDAAAAVADRRGLAGVSMRNVGAELGVEAMSLYHHVAGKERLLDALSEWVFARIELPAADDDWREGMTRRARSAREVLVRHPWGIALIESRRAAGPALLGHHDAVLGCLRRDGFDVRLAAHAFSVIDAYVYGFALTEQKLPLGADETAEEFADQLAPPAELYPHLAELLAELVTGRDYAFADEFDHGLELILDGLEARLESTR